MTEILIKNGLIADGSGKDVFAGDVLVADNRITEVGSVDALKHPDAEVIDATGLVVAPGFIDTHSHSDLEMFDNPGLSMKLRQGITTEILGQDGVSMAPVPEEFIEAWKINLAGLDGASSNFNWNGLDTASYLEQMRKLRPALNEMYLVPHGNVRMEAMGLDDREPSAEELARMCEIVEREMDAGAIGLSSGLIYMPCAYAKTEELIELCKVVAKKDGIFVVHQRSEADTIIDSMKEIIRIGRESGVRIHFSHFKVCGKKNWDKTSEMLRLIDEAKAEGITVSFDQYPYVAGSTTLSVILPPWVYDGGNEMALERLKDAGLRKRMREDIENGIPGWDNFIDFAGFDKIFITSVQSEANKSLIGKSLTEIASIKGKDPFEASFDLLLEEKNAVGMVDFYGLEDHVRLFMSRDEMNVCTDGLMNGKPHPRVYGSFPRVLGRYARDGKLFPIGVAVRKMTGKPADTFRIKDRGYIRNNYYADITVFDPDTVVDVGTYEDPTQYPKGINYVIINGNIVLANGRESKEHFGEIL